MTPLSRQNRSRKRRMCSGRGIAIYIRLVLFDFACIAIAGAVIAGLHQLPTLFPSYRIMPYTMTPASDGQAAPSLHVPEEYSYPMQVEILGDLMCGVIVTLVPIAIIGFMQIFVRNFWDFHAGCIGALKAVMASEIFPVVLKAFNGGFRPFYVALCKPDLTQLAQEYHTQIQHGVTSQTAHFFGPGICTEKVPDSLQSFPSGHTASAFAAGVFLSLYLNAKLKAFADHASQFWVFCVVIIPILGASLISATRYVSHHHHAHDVLLGAIIGLIFGALAYRSSYAAIFDFRYNHIPLPPSAAHIQFTYSSNASSEEEALLLTDSLVICGWRWSSNKMAARVSDEEARWLNSLPSLRATAQHLGKHNEEDPVHEEELGSVNRQHRDPTFREVSHWLKHSGIDQSGTQKTGSMDPASGRRQRRTN